MNRAMVGIPAMAFFFALWVLIPAILVLLLLETKF